MAPARAAAPAGARRQGAGGGAGAGGGSTGGSGAAGGSTAPAGGNGGATDVGVTATTITIGNIASISGVAPGLTQSAQQATQAVAAYVNSQGGIDGRQLKVQTYDDGNDSGTNFADATQACSGDFALVGSASGFDDGSATAVAKCGIPDMAAEVSTTAAGNTADIYGASPGNAHYWPVGPAEYLKSKYPSAVTKAAMIYLNVPATADQAQREMQAYSSVGFDYVYPASVTATEPNYAPYVLQMQQKGVQYVTEYSDTLARPACSRPCSSRTSPPRSPTGSPRSTPPTSSARPSRPPTATWSSWPPRPTRRRAPPRACSSTCSG